MIDISVDKFVRTEVYHNVSGKHKLQVENLEKINRSLDELSKQLEKNSAEQTV